MSNLTMYDPETNQYVEVYQPICRCGAKLTISEVKIFGDRCESCENNYIDYEHSMQQSNEC